MLPSRVERV